MKLIDALQESQWDYFVNCIYDCCNELGATDNISANCLINQLANMEINAVPVPNYRVAPKEVWMEQYCTKKRLAGWQKQQEDKCENN